jgi:hypothetical protein
MRCAFTAIFTGTILILSFVAVAADTFENAKTAFGKGDYATALRLYRPLANQGNAEAQYNLGWMYDIGKGVPKNDAEAAKWYRLAAEQGVAKAQTALGVIYTFEALRTGDYTEALRWYRVAANQGDAHGQYVLGNMYHEGQGVPQNFGEAAKWYRLAAEQGKYDAERAQFLLGNMYAKGEGVPQNYVRAYMWLSLAAAKAAPFKKNRDIVAGLMTAAQIAEAQKLAAEWRPKTANASPEIAPQSPPLSGRPETSATSGTAFFIAQNGEALTNAHVVEGCKQISVNGGTARLLARDAANDLALLATDQHPSKWASWRLSVRQGEDVVAYGFPLSGVLSSGGNVVTGNVTALAGLGDDSRFLQISAPVQPGNSGGPLFDRYGNVVGVVVAKLNALKIASATGDIPQNVNFAIKASVAIGFLDAQRVTYSAEAPPPPGSMLDALSTPDIATRAQALAVQVVCIQ